MLSLKVEITGSTAADIEAALDEVTRSVENGNTCGFDRSTTGRYFFEVTGEEGPRDPARETLQEDWRP